MVNERQRLRRWILQLKPELFTLLAYLLLTIVVCWPLPLRWNVALAGRHPDAMVFWWNQWWVRAALERGVSPMHTDAIYYPLGASLASHNTNWAATFLALPLDFLWGLPTAYNALFLLSFFLPAWGMYLLVRHLTSQRGAAFVAGLTWAFFPYHLSGNWDGQMNLANIQWLPLAVLFWLRAAQDRRWRDAIGAGVFAALALFDCLFFPLFLAIWGVIWIFWSLGIARERWDFRLLLLGITVIATAAVLSAPVWVPVIRDAGQQSLALASSYYTGKGTDLLKWVVPSSLHPLLGPLVDSLYQDFDHWRPAFVGYVALVLAVLGLVKAPRRNALWGITALIFGWLALGDLLTVGGRPFPQFPSLFRGLTGVVPLIKVVRQASRFNVMLMFAIAVLAGEGVASLTRGTGWRKRALLAALSALILFEYVAWPCPSLSTEVSPFYATLAADRSPFALVELPLDELYSRRSMFAQTVHGHPLVNGYLARVPDDLHAFIYSNPLLKRWFLRMPADPQLVDLQRDLDILAANGIRYVVIHKDDLPPHPAVDPAIQADWRASLGGSPFYEDDSIAVFRLSPPAWADVPGVSLGADLTLLQVNARRVDLIGHPFLAVDLVWRAERRIESTYTCTLSLGDGDRIWGVVEDTISPQFPTARWPAGTVVGERYLIPVPASSAAPYQLTLTLSTVQLSSVASTTITLADDGPPSLLVPALAALSTPVDAHLADTFWLLGYTSVHQAQTLHLDLYWLAERAPWENVKCFVHLVDPETDQIVRQYDWMPRDWSYPTSLWSRGEVFVDRISLDTGELPPGRYVLFGGMYQPEGSRLPAVDRSGVPVPDGRILLGEVEIP